MYKYFQSTEDPDVFWRHNTDADKIDVFFLDEDDTWSYSFVIDSGGLYLAEVRGEVKEINYDPVVNV